MTVQSLTNQILIGIIGSTLVPFDLLPNRNNGRLAPVLCLLLPIATRQDLGVMQSYDAVCLLNTTW